MTEKQHILIRTTTETFEYDPDKIRQKFSMHWRAFAGNTNAFRADRGLPTLSQEQLFEDFIIDMFERHDGSQFGDDLFSQIDCDSGIVLGERSIDE